jgi:hypothetical protein
MPSQCRLRSRLYSLFMGLLMAGIAIGPSIGALLIRASNQVLSVFYGAFAWHILYTLFLWFLVPESLSKVQMADSMSRHRTGEGRRVGWRKTVVFLAPLSVFTPGKLQKSHAGKLGRDWNMMLFGVGYASMISIMVGRHIFVFRASNNFTCRAHITTSSSTLYMLSGGPRKL